MQVCTIVARNYLPQARVLAQSFRQHNPDIPFSCLVIDDVDRVVDASSEPFAVLHLDEILVDHRELHRMALHYDVMELATAVKPLLLGWLVEKYGDAACYLDPDIQVFDSFHDIERLALQHGIVLTPHAASPIPRDGLRPSEVEILRAGIYNLGFIAVGAQSDAFLGWWWERLQRDALVDPLKQLFTDQRWVDFVPGYFSHTILRHPGCNVAYWNLHGRSVRRAPDGAVTVDGEPLIFFHFSGYVPEEPWQLSKHQGHAPRVLFSEHPLVRDLCTNYGDLLAAAGRGADRPSYGYRELPDGTQVDRYVRLAYRTGLAGTEGSESEPPEPFDRKHPETFTNWLRSRDAARSWASVSRYGWALHDAWPDLQSAFSANTPSAGAAFAEWADREAQTRGAQGQLVPAVDGVFSGQFELSPADDAQGNDDELAVNVVGYLRAELGVGEAGRLAVATLQRAGVRVNTITFEETSSRQQHPFEEIRDGAAGDINLLCINADRTGSFVRQAGDQFFADRYTIGSWFWELEEFPEEMRGGFAHVDEVWAGSKFARDSLRALADKPVHAFPPAIVRPEVDPAITRADLGLPVDRPLVLFAFDYFSILERKNPLGLIDAFCRAFPAGDGPVLVLKSVNGDKVRRSGERLRQAVGDRPDIVLMDGYLAHDARAALIAHADCYASLHRSEGFGLTMAEAMTLGTPVVATGYSGNLDFMDDSNSWLVPFTPISIPAGCDPYPTTAKWADPDIDAAAEALRFILAGGFEVDRRVENARRVEIEHGLDARADWARARLEEIRSMRKARGAQRTSSQSLSLSLSRTGSHAAAVPGGPLQSRLSLYKARLAVARDPQLRRVALVRRAGPLITALQERQRAETEGLRSEVQVLRRAAEGLRTEVQALRRAAESAGLEYQQLRQDLGQVYLHGEALTADTTRALTHLQDELAEVQAVAGGLLGDLHDVRASLDTSPEAHVQGGLRVRGVRGTQTLGFSAGSATDAATPYVDFEDVFRGPEALIMQRQEEYLRLLEFPAPVLDMGCGRGEFLQLLATADIPAEGLDSDRGMVERSKSKGLNVQLGEALQYLTGLLDGSLGAVTCFQVLEHLDPTELLPLFSQVHRVLRPGGFFLAETVNPHNTTALRAFWLDLTHRHPLFPESLIMQARAAGFRAAEILFPGGSGDYDADRVSCGDYALLAYV